MHFAEQEVITVMKPKAVSSILEIVMVASTGTLVLFFIAEIILDQDVFFAHHLVVIVIAVISVMLWYWYQNRHVAFQSGMTPIRKADAHSSGNYSQKLRFNPDSCSLIPSGP